MEQPIFVQLSLILGVAAGISVLFRLLRQPLIIGYILTGFLVGPSLLNVVRDHAAFTSFSQIGIALLLFVIGLGLNVATIKATGKPVLVAFLAVVVGVGGLVLLLGRLLGLTQIESLVLTVAMLFSSTIVVITALSDKKEQSRLFGQIAIGVLLLEDIMATIALIFVAGGAGHGAAGGSAGSGLALLLIKGAALAVMLTLCGIFLLPRAIQWFARSQELLYISALAWAFGVASIFYWYGFSLEVGALFAGVAMAHLPYAREISTRLKPLRDFFIVLFFVELGQNFDLANISSAIGPAVILSIIVMIIKPLMILLSLGLLGYTKQTGFKSAVHLSQISEFSIVLVVLAVNNGVVSPRITAIVTLTAVITIILSAYMMKYDDELYAWLQKPLSIFERSRTKDELKQLKTYPLVLLGYRNGGHEFVRTFRSMARRYIVIDYDPEVIEQLEHQHVNHLYGDVTDLELLEEISLYDSELVVSVIPDIATNLMLVNHIMGHPQHGQDKPTIFVCHAASLEEAVRLYEQGASYVLLPHFIGSEKASNFIRRNGSDKAAFDRYRERHMLHLGKTT